MVNIVEAIKRLFPKEYLNHIKEINLEELKSVKLKDADKNPVFNIRVEIKPSAYFPSGKTFVLCKTFSDILYFPDTQRYIKISDPIACDCVLDAIRTSFTVSAFGCCSKYEQCSDARECLHSNPFYSLGCIYRTNLEAGRIFYGVNRNV